MLSVTASTPQYAATANYAAATSDGATVTAH